VKYGLAGDELHAARLHVETREAGWRCRRRDKRCDQPALAHSADRLHIEDEQAWWDAERDKMASESSCAPSACRRRKRAGAPSSMSTATRR